MSRDCGFEISEALISNNPSIGGCKAFFKLIDVTMQKYFTVDNHIKAFEHTLAKGQSIVSQAGAERCTKKPDSDTWSIVEILDHLNFVDGLYIDPISDKFRQKDYKPTGRVKFKHRFWVRLTCKFFEPPYKIKFKVPGDNEPESGLSIDEVKQEFVQKRKKLIELAEQGRGLALDKITVTSPLSDMIKLSISESFSFLACHQRRHLWQAEQVLERIS